MRLGQKVKVLEDGYILNCVVVIPPGRIPNKVLVQFVSTGAHVWVFENQIVR